jgi:hypothetical protein
VRVTEFLPAKCLGSPAKTICSKTEERAHLKLTILATTSKTVQYEDAPINYIQSYIRGDQLLLFSLGKRRAM